MGLLSMFPNNIVFPSGRELTQKKFETRLFRDPYLAKLSGQAYSVHEFDIQQQDVNLITLSNPLHWFTTFLDTHYLVYYLPHASRDIFNPDRFLGRAITPDADRFPHLNSQTAFYYAQHPRAPCLVCLLVTLLYFLCYVSFGIRHSILSFI